MASIQVLPYEPTDLEYDELQHELYIRNIMGLSNARSETNALRQVLQRETKGDEKPPTVSLLNSMDEMKNASIAYDGILVLKDQAMCNGDIALLGKIRSRTAVWINRMNRMLDKGFKDYNELLKKYHELYDAIVNFRRDLPRFLKNKGDLHGHPNGSIVDLNGHSNADDERSELKNIANEKSIDLHGQDNASANILDFYSQDPGSRMRNDIQDQSKNKKTSVNNFDLHGQGNETDVNFRGSSGNATAPPSQNNQGPLRTLENNQGWFSHTMKTDSRGRGRGLVNERKSLPSNLFSKYSSANQEGKHNSQSEQSGFNRNYFCNDLRNPRPLNIQRVDSRVRDIEVPVDFQMFNEPPLRRVELITQSSFENQQVRNVNYNGDNIRVHDGNDRDRNIRNDNYGDEFRNVNNYDCRYNHRSQIHKWRILFTGDGKGLSLSEFLTRVSVYARGDGITNEQLFVNFYHLLSGRAERWYWSSINEFRTLNDLVNGLRNEFLPRNYDFFLREEIQNRLQMPGELFTSFISDLKMLFQKVYPPLDEQYKLYVIRKNMLPQYGSQLAVTDINSVEQLVNLCRRLDENQMMTDRRRVAQNFMNIPLVEPSCFPAVSHRDSHKRVNYLHEIYNDCIEPNFQNQNYLASPNEQYQSQFYNQFTKGNAEMQHLNTQARFYDDVDNCGSRVINNAYSGNFDHNSTNVLHVDEVACKNSRTSATSNSIVCYNCKRTGHLLRDCKVPLRGIMCFLCGKEGVKIPECNCNSYVRPQNYNRGGDGKNVRFSDKINSSNSGNRQEEAQRKGASALPQQRQ